MSKVEQRPAGKEVSCRNWLAPCCRVSSYCTDPVQGAEARVARASSRSRGMRFPPFCSFFRPPPADQILASRRGDTPLTTVPPYFIPGRSRCSLLGAALPIYEHVIARISPLSRDVTLLRAELDASDTKRDDRVSSPEESIGWKRVRFDWASVSCYPWIAAAPTFLRVSVFRVAALESGPTDSRIVFEMTIFGPASLPRN